MNRQGPGSPMEAPDWAVRGLRPWTLLVWLPACWSLAFAPVFDPEPRKDAGAAVLVAVAAAALFTAVVLTRYWPRGSRTPAVTGGTLAALGTLAGACTALWSPAWSSLFGLMAIGVGAAVVDRRSPLIVLSVTVLATGSTLLGGASADQALTTTLTVVLAGLGTYAVHQLFAVVAELRHTRDELARLAVSAERDRFARDLHDLLGHTLSVIVVKAEAVRRLVPLDGDAAVVHAGDIETIGREALSDVRRAAAGYRGAGLARELDRARVALEAAGVTLTLHRPDDTDTWPEETDELLGWVVREGVTNVVRHARATTARSGWNASPDHCGSPSTTTARTTTAWPARAPGAPGSACWACGNGWPRPAAGSKPAAARGVSPWTS